MDRTKFSMKQEIMNRGGEFKMKKGSRKPLIVLVVAIMVFGSSVMTVSAAPYVGEIRLFAGNFAPAGWMECDGSTLPISENEVLFNLIGTIYGGDGVSNFCLPDLRGLEPYPGTRYIISIFGIFPSQT